MTTRAFTGLLATTLLGGFGCAATDLANNQLSARDHEAAAAAEKELAREHASRFDPKAVRYVELYPEPLASAQR